MKFFRSQEGFSLVELMVVSTIIGILATTLVLNFRTTGNRSALRQATQQIMSDIRRAQSLALSSTRVGGQPRCGFGVYYVDSGVYGIYAGPDSQVSDCNTENKNYEVGRDAVYQGVSFISREIEFVSSFPDIFFEPPDPKTYIDNISPAGTSAQIVLRIVGGICPGDCSTILVTPVGVVDSQ